MTKQIKKPELQTIQFYDWCDIEQVVQTKAKRSLHDWKQAHGSEKKPEYCNFWHVMIDVANITHGCIRKIDFEEIRWYYRNDGQEEKTTPEWIDEIIDVIQDVMGTGEHTIRFDW